MTSPRTDAWYGQLPKLHVYVDETGDRGFSQRAREKSPFFAMTALIVPAEEEWNIKVTAGGLRALVHTGRPQDVLKPIHWVEHFKAKHHDRRQHAALALARMPDAMVIHVIAHKDTVNQDAGMRRDGGLFYNYTTRLLLERVAYAAQGWRGGSRLAIVRLGTVKHMDHSSSESHLDWVRQGNCSNYGVPWGHIKWPPTWQNTQRDGIQLADIHAGLLNAALSAKPDDAVPVRNLLLCRHQLRRSWDGQVLGYGVKVIGDPAFVTGRSWWRDWRCP
jgi:hypothetical protein